MSHEKETNEFLEEAKSGRPNFIKEFWDFLRHNKKWWLLPIIVVLILFAALLIVAGTGAAPFIYTLF